MKDGAIVCNSGHFNVEINIPALRALAAEEPRLVRPFVEQFRMADGRAINLLAEGRLVNLAAAEGHPASVMDMSFANQALGAEYMQTNGGTLEPRVYTLPADIDQEIARLKLAAMGVQIDTVDRSTSRISEPVAGRHLDPHSPARGGGESGQRWVSFLRCARMGPRAAA